MAYVALPRFLLRAPLLPLRALANPARAFLNDALGPTALALASPDLSAGLARGTRATTALDRYGRRAAFRPTPHGLLAGVGVGRLSARTNIRTSQPHGVLRPAWTRLCAMARALLEDPEIRDQVRVRRAPSVVVGANALIWLGPGEQDGWIEERRADLDALTATVLDATEDWAAWPAVRAAISGASGSGDGDADELLTNMVDDGLLHVDLVPPLVGPEPGDWMSARLRTIVPARLVAEELATARMAARAGDVAGAARILQSLPGSAPPASGLDATLVFSPPRPPTLARAAVERAAALAPLLFQLQEALSPPVAERTPSEQLADALDATAETFGAGAIDLGAFAMGDYGVNPAGDGLGDGGDDRRESRPRTNAPDPGLISLLVDRMTAAARRRLPEVALRSEELVPLLPPVATPPTCELFVTPGRARAGKPPGDGWLLGLHAPAGASWGRFAFALGDAAAPLLEPLRDAERGARPGEQAADVVFCPRQALGDICAHPPVRPAALALTGWPADDVSALTIGDLELCADPAAIEPLALRTSQAAPVTPSPLHRVRSTNAPPGVWRLLAGWSLCRQHAPWALTLSSSPLGDLDWTPRFSIDGFVVAPASWRIPAAVATRGASSRAVRSWRQDARLPRFVQVGDEDELLPVDLTSPGAAADLAGHARVFEIWPPIGDTPDESGRRIEAVIALVDQPGAAEGAGIEAAIAATAGAGVVPPPRRTVPPRGTDTWLTFKLFGVSAAQDTILVDVVTPAIRDARAAGEIEEWFFLRYVDPPGRRPHLRLRVRVAKDDGRFARRLEARLGPAREIGDVVAVERTSYFPEAARFGGPAGMPAIHACFQADSDLACALLSLQADPDELFGSSNLDDERIGLLVATFDALGGAWGLDAAARRQLARRRRDAHAADVTPELADAQARWFRELRNGLRDLLAGRRPRPWAAAFSAYEARVRKVSTRLAPETRDKILPSLLHLTAVRLMGLDRLSEIHAYTFWERTLESLERHPVS